MKFSIIIIVLIISVGTLFSFLGISQENGLIKFFAAFGLFTIIALVGAVVLLGKRKK